MIRQIINSNTLQKDINSIIEDIDKGLSNKSGGIKLDPDYQRTFQFGEAESSLLIESLIIGIPIPTIYLATDSSKAILMYNVIDGQHRLRSIYNYIKGKYSLKGLKKNEDLVGKKFKDLDDNLQNIILYQNFLTFVNIHVQDDKDIEIEIFERYNRNTKPLSEQEIRNAVYSSEFADMIKNYINENKDKKHFKTNFNATDKRIYNSSLMENLLTGLNIIVNGNNKSFSTSPKYADDIMKKYKKSFGEDDKSEVEEALKRINIILKKYGGDYLFSKEIIDDHKSNYKFQIPAFMVFCMVLNKTNANKVNTEYILKIYKQALEIQKKEMSKTTTSSTNPQIIETISQKIDGILND